MKTKTFLALFVCTLAASAIAQHPATYTATEAAKHVGEIATITDRVDGVLFGLHCRGCSISALRAQLSSER